ncbi:MAG: hypothetical protein AB7V08_08755 [Elusimicrobiales bacterium]
MNELYVNYKVCKKIKDILGSDAPLPLDLKFFATDKILFTCAVTSLKSYDIPAYQLHDILSKKFCEALANLFESGVFCNSTYIAVCLLDAYQTEGFNSLETELEHIINERALESRSAKR